MLALTGMSKQDLGESLPNGRWGTRSLDPFVTVPDSPPANGESPRLIIEFSAPVQVVSLRVGDFDSTSNMPEDDVLRLFAFSGTNGTGSLLDTDAPTNLTPHPTLGFNQKRLTVTDTEAGIRSVILQAGAGTLMNGFKDFLSVFIDRIYFDADSIVLPEDVDDENNDGDNVFGTQQASVPEPASAAVLVLGAAMVLTRRPRRA